MFDDVPEALDQGHGLVDRKRLERTDRWKDPLLPERLDELSWWVGDSHPERMGVQARVRVPEKVGKRRKNQRADFGLRSRNVRCQLVWTLSETALCRDYVAMMGSTVPRSVSGRRESNS